MKTLISPNVQPQTLKIFTFTEPTQIALSMQAKEFDKNNKIEKQWFSIQMNFRYKCLSFYNYLVPRMKYVLQNCIFVHKQGYILVFVYPQLNN